MDAYVEEVYKIVRQFAAGVYLVIHENHILALVGRHGLNALIEYKYVETCGPQLYALCCEKES